MSLAGHTRKHTHLHAAGNPSSSWEKPTTTKKKKTVACGWTVTQENGTHTPCWLFFSWGSTSHQGTPPPPPEPPAPERVAGRRSGRAARNAQKRSPVTEKKTHTRDVKLLGFGGVARPLFWTGLDYFDITQDMWNFARLKKAQGSTAGLPVTRVGTRKGGHLSIGRAPKPVFPSASARPYSLLVVVIKLMMNYFSTMQQQPTDPVHRVTLTWATMNKH